MEGVGNKLCYCCLVAMVILSLKCVNSRPLTPHNTTSSSSVQQVEAGTSRKEESSERAKREVGVTGEELIGSRPPRCEHRCNGCSPCEATQVPTNHHVGIQFANYEPEGWKCKCGPTFYTP